MSLNQFFENTMIMFTVGCILASLFNNHKSKNEKDYRPAIFLMLSLISASYFSYIDRISGHGLVMIILAYACIFRRDGRWFSCVNIEENEILFALSFIYMLRVGAVLMHLSGIIGIECFWVVSMFFLSMQNMLVLGGCLNGYRRRNNNRITNFRIKLDYFAFSKKRIQS